MVGLAAMLLPVTLDQFDIYGMKVSCGTGLSSHLHGEGPAVASQCDTTLLIRRLWAIPAAVIGWLIVTGFLVMWARAEQRDRAEGAESPHYRPHPEIAS